MSSWYTRAELTRRVAWLYTGNSLANMFGGLISFGVLRDLNGVHGIAGWVCFYAPCHNILEPLVVLTIWNRGGFS